MLALYLCVCVFARMYAHVRVFVAQSCMLQLSSHDFTIP